jgi:hypothetical protein
MPFVPLRFTNSICGRNRYAKLSSGIAGKTAAHKGIKTIKRNAENEIPMQIQNDSNCCFTANG